MFCVENIQRVKIQNGQGAVTPRPFLNPTTSKGSGESMYDYTLEKFNARLGKTDENGCIHWGLALDSDGYGSVSIKGKAQKAHRVSYYLHKGLIPDGLVVRHTCDVKSCVNPEHLIVGTVQENADDAVERNRLHKPKGTLHPNARIEERDVLAIREMCRRFQYSGRHRLGGVVKFLAEWYGLHPVYVSRIKNRKRWSHL